MSDINRLVYAILEFLEQQIQNGALNEDATESVEVAIQCLESAYGVSSSDDTIRSQLSTGTPLLDIFNSACNESCPSSSSTGMPRVTTTNDAKQVISDEDKMKAEQLKSEGNEFMKIEKYDDAVSCYSKAITIDKTNAVYYCNRAAAYHKLNKHQQAIDDGNKAITLDPKYSKAFGRLGLAYSCMNNHQKAKESFSKALELDPTNEGHRANLNIAEQKIQESSLGGPRGFGGQPSFGGMDLASVLNNPMLMNMASQMMTNPQMQQMMQGILGQGMSGAFGGGQLGGESVPTTNQSNTNQTPGQENTAAQADGISSFLRAGQELAQHVQQQNPELVEQLKQQFQQMPGGNNQQPPPDAGSGGV